MSKHPIDILKERGVIDELAGDMSPEEIETAMKISRKVLDTYIEAFAAVQKGFDDPEAREKLKQHFGMYGTAEDKVEELFKEGTLVEDPEEDPEEDDDG
jgi:hypothetical protein